MGISRRFVDLHMHSTASDGTTPPEKLMEVARPCQRGGFRKNRKNTLWP